MGVPRWQVTGLVVVGFAVAFLIGAALLLLAAVMAFGWLPGVRRPDYSHGVSAGDLASLAVAGATLLLADFTAILAWLTRRSLAATRREAEIAESALAASNKQATVAEDSLAAARELAKTTQDLVTATNEVARIAQAQLVASWRPMLVDPSERGVEIGPSMIVTFVNIGPGPAFVRKGLLGVGAAVRVADEVKPRIVPTGDEVHLTFRLLLGQKPTDQAIGMALSNGTELNAAVFYHDITGERAWRSRGRLVGRRTEARQLVDVEVSDADMQLLD
jgi:hypothetical protein